MVTGRSTASEEDNNKSACSHLKEVLGDSPPVFLVSPPYLIIQKCHHPLFHSSDGEKKKKYRTLKERLVILVHLVPSHS